MIKVINVISDTNIGGAGKCLLNYLTHADREKYDISVVLPKDSLLKPHITQLGYKVFEINSMSDKSLDKKAVFELIKLFKHEKPAIVHSHASMSARIAGRLCGATIIYTRHSVFPPPEKISKGIGKKLNGIVNNYFSDGIMAVAEAAKDNLTDTGVDAKKIKVILNGVDPLEKFDDEKRNELRLQLGVGPDEPVISMISRLTAVKGHKYLIKAAKLLIDSGIKAKFIIAGTGDAEASLKLLVQTLDLQNYFIFPGFVEDVTSLLNVTDIQVNASYGTEATSLALLEGMSLGIPAVVSDFGGNPGVITSGKNGLIVPKQDVDALFSALQLMITTPQYFDTMKQDAIKIYNEKFTAEIMSRNWEDFYKSVYIAKGGVNI